MGLDYNALKLLLWGKNLGVSFERTLTLGRQNLLCTRRQISQLTQVFGTPLDSTQIEHCVPLGEMRAIYADKLLEALGAKELVSVDYSDFEGASLIHDLNQRFPEHERERYSLVIDGGTLEHVFDFPSAFRNCLELLAVGGHYLATTPAHGEMGHGFYQFSPELFFRVFSTEHGFELRKIVLYNPSKVNAPFYQVHDPANTGFRNQLKCSHPMTLAVLAQRVNTKPILAAAPMQSDYVASWKQTRQQSGKTPARDGFMRRLRLRLNPYWPDWLRRIKSKWQYRKSYGNPTLSNRRDYQLLANEEIFRERMSPRI